MTVKTVYIEITNRCNFNCRTCYNRSGLNRETLEISAAKIQDIISLFSSYGAKRFLFSGGEPTLHSEFDRILELIENRSDLSFGIVTNGSCLNSKLIELLNRARNITLQISLDGSCEEQNSKTRGAGHFDMAVKFVKMIRNPALRPLLKMVISQGNIDDVENFYRLAARLGCIPEYAFIYRSGNAKDLWERKAVSSQDKLKILKLIDRLNEEYGISAFLPICTSSCPFIKGADAMSIAIKTDGSIQPCQSLYSSEYTLANLSHFDASELEDIPTVPSASSSSMTKRSERNRTYEFDKNPPYEVRSTPWLSAGDLDLLHRTEEALERVYNSGRFLLSADYVLRASALTPFEFYTGLGVAARKARADRGVSLDDYTAVFQEYCASIKGVERETLRDFLVRDRISTNPSGRLPPCLRRQDARLAKAAKWLAKNPVTGRWSLHEFTLDRIPAYHNFTAD